MPQPVYRVLSTYWYCTYKTFKLYHPINSNVIQVVLDLEEEIKVIPIVLSKSFLV